MMFTTTPLPRFGQPVERRGIAAGCEPCRRGAAGGVPIGTAFVVGAVVLFALAVI